MDNDIENNYDQKLDHKFAWRWLLPLNDCDSISVLGFEEKEKRWWDTKYKLSSSCLSSGVLAALDNLDSKETNIFLKINTNKFLAAWGSRNKINALKNKINGYDDVRIYAFLPFRSPKLLIPLNKSKYIVSSLKLHNPGRFLLKIAVVIISFWSRMGLPSIFFTNLLLVANRDSNMRPNGIRLVEQSDVVEAEDFALYFGSPGLNRKTVALPLGGARTRVIVKTAQSYLACKSLRDEIKALNTLNKTSLSENLPYLSCFNDSKLNVTLVQEYRKRSYLPTKLIDSYAKNFLYALALQEVKHIKLHDTLLEIPISDRLFYPEIFDFLKSLPTTYVLRLNRCHGDFASWNCEWTDSGFFVYDWEASVSSGLALSDAFYYITSRLMLIEKSVDGGRALKKICKFVHVLATELGLQKEIKIYLAYWILSSKNKNILYRNLSLNLLLL